MYYEFFVPPKHPDPELPLQRLNVAAVIASITTTHRDEGGVVRRVVHATDNTLLFVSKTPSTARTCD